MLASETLKLLKAGESNVQIETMAKLYQAYSSRFYLVYGGKEEMRRSGLDKDFLEPFKLIGALIEKVATELGDQDIVQMLSVYAELDRNYDGFY